MVEASNSGAVADIRKSQGTSPDQNTCSSCGAEPESGHRAQLCANCRKKMARRPLPWWVLLTLFAMASIGIAGTYIQRHNFSAALHFERGSRAEKRGNYADAIAHYQLALKLVGESAKLRVRLAKSYFAQGQPRRAIENLMVLKRQKLPTDVANEANSILTQIEEGRNHAHPR